MTTVPVRIRTITSENVSDFNLLPTPVDDEILIGISFFTIDDDDFENDQDSLPPIELKLKKCEEETKCSICFKNIKKDSNVPNIECSHIFHKKCLKKWIKINNNCPLCRQIIE